jgi:GNAT superfamily N-acetyltransferase
MKDTERLQFTKRVPTLAEFRELRTNAGWRLPPDSIASPALAKTLFGVCVETPEGQTIGMGRVVGDGGLQVFVTDVIVHADWQNRGIGSKIVKLLVEHIESGAAPSTFVGLFSAFGRDRFYEKLGFIARPNETLGPGMVLLRKEAERQ